uniref:YggT family protein n=1 Tax=Zooxanthella nutricula TaxID=1333877 RepID=A0A7S2II74_9DINO
MGWEDFVVGPVGLINTGLNLYKTALGIYALMSWLVAFGIVDLRNEIAQKVQGALSSIIDPVLAPLRSVIPPLAGFDISFMVLWFVLEQAQAAAVAIMFGALSFEAYNTYY